MILMELKLLFLIQNIWLNEVMLKQVVSLQNWLPLGYRELVTLCKV